MCRERYVSFYNLLCLSKSLVNALLKLATLKLAGATGNWIAHKSTVLVNNHSSWERYEAFDNVTAIAVRIRSDVSVGNALLLENIYSFLLSVVRVCGSALTPKTLTPLSL